MTETNVEGVVVVDWLVDFLAKTGDVGFLIAIILPSGLFTVLFLFMRSVHRKVDVADRARFSCLVKEWERDVEIESSRTMITSHPAYLKIIAMGRIALPYIFEHIKHNPGDGIHFAVALEAISDEQPVPVEDFGVSAKVEFHWICWAEQRGLWPKG